MRILHLTNMWPSKEKPYNGTFVKTLVEALRRTEGKHDVLIIPAEQSKWEYFRAIFRLRRLLSKKKYDFIHTQYAHSALVASMVKKLPVIAHFHNEFGYRDKTSGELFRDAPNLLGYRWSAFLARLAARLSQAVIVVNPSDLELIHSKAKTIIPIGVDESVFYPISREKACKMLGWNPEPLRVLFPSDPSRPEKNYKLFEAVMSKLKQIFPDIQSVVLKGKVPHEKMPLYLNAVDLMLLTSRTEASSTVIKEANFCNLPVVACPAGDAREQLEGVSPSAVVPPDINLLTGTCVKILKERKRSNGRIKVKDYSINTTVKKVLSFYERILR